MHDQQFGCCIGRWGWLGDFVGGGEWDYDETMIVLIDYPTHLLQVLSKV